MANIRLKKGQTDPKNPHATSVKGAVKSTVDVNTVAIKGKKASGDETTAAPMSEVFAAEAVEKEAATTKYKILIMNWDYKTRNDRGDITMNTIASDPLAAWDNLGIPDTMLRDEDIINIFTDVNSGTLDKNYYPIIVSTCVYIGKVSKKNLDVQIEWSAGA